MEVNRILAEIDDQIEKLQKARAALVGIEDPPARGRGRPRGSSTSSPTPEKTATKRQLSPEGRKRIADAMKRRWAERKKTTAK